VGLEPAGTLPDPGQLARKDLGRTLAAVRNTVHSELHRSFFITRQMDSQFRGQVTDGGLSGRFADGRAPWDLKRGKSYWQ